MKQYTDKEILEIYQHLPEDLKKAIFGVDTTEIVKNIGQKYQLQIDKIGVLGNETGLVMLGITHPDNFIANLAERLKVDGETAKKIGEEVSNQIFAKVRESLKKIQEAPTPRPEISGVGAPTSPEASVGVPEIIKGTTVPVPSAPSNLPVVEVQPPKVEEKKYPNGDPYREPIQ